MLLPFPINQFRTPYSQLPFRISEPVWAGSADGALANRAPLASLGNCMRLCICMFEIHNSLPYPHSLSPYYQFRTPYSQLPIRISEPVTGLPETLGSQHPHLGDDDCPRSPVVPASADPSGPHGFRNPNWELGVGSSESVLGNAGTKAK